MRALAGPAAYDLENASGVASDAMHNHASHATNNVVRGPSMTGPWPQSYCSHIPGSVTHGWCTRTAGALDPLLSFGRCPSITGSRACTYRAPV